MLFIDINLCRLEDDECIQDINEQKIQERHFSFLSKEPRYPPLLYVCVCRTYLHL